MSADSGRSVHPFMAPLSEARPDLTVCSGTLEGTDREAAAHCHRGMSVSQAAIAQVMTASNSARVAPSRACTDRPCTTVV